MRKAMVILPLLIIIVCASYAIRVSSKADPTFLQSLDPAFSPYNTTADNPAPPAAPVKLIFIHHSTGGNWLADPNADQYYGGLGRVLMDNNYFVSATNYGWGPDQIGSNTDIGYWWDWFRGSNSTTYLAALYSESGQNICNPINPDYECFGNWPRLATDPGGPNEIIVFKGCFPNAHLSGSPNDPATSGENPLRGQSAWIWDDGLGGEIPNPNHTVANAKGIYNDILLYFAAHQDKLFIVVTGPPLLSDDAQFSTDAAHAANYRAFNDWLVNDWLDGYLHDNVAVFNYYNVLTSNGGDPETNDAGQETGNHHRWWNNAVQYIHPVAYDFSAYGMWSDSHPTTAGQQKAADEFIQLLNVFYNRWKHGVQPAPTLTLVQPNGGENWQVNSQQSIQWTSTNLSGDIHIEYSTDHWSTTHDIVASITNTGIYTWTVPNDPSANTRVRVSSIITTSISDASDAVFTIYQPNTTRKDIFLPMALKIYVPVPPGDNLVQPADFTYLGAFRLPDGEDAPQTFAYGGNAMSFNPDGHIANTDSHSGSLFITGQDRSDGYPDGSQVAEISIPVPVNSRTIADLPYAEFIQGFHDVTAGHFLELGTIPKIGIQYLNHAATGPKLHITWGRHLQQLEDYLPSQAWVNVDLANPNLQGEWFIGKQNPNSVNGYLFDIPVAWADANTQSRYLATGRFHPGGQGGMGPSLFAYTPWLAGGAVPASGTNLAETTLLHYQSAAITETIMHSQNNYQHADEWEGGAWLTTPSGKSAVLFAGTKGTGDKYWYGYIHPTDPALPCVDMEVIHDFWPCRLASGDRCPETDVVSCCTEGGNCVSARGWWSTRFDAQLVLYAPSDLAQVAAGTLQSWEPQPYATLDIDGHLYFDVPEWDEFEMGWGDQRRTRLGAAAYDRINGYLYILELFGDGAKPVVHVWQVR